MAAAGQWVPPLPPGWEARWDANQRAYFYINHQNRGTTWVDPRPAYYTKYPQPSAYGETASGHASTAAQLLNQSDLTQDANQGISLSTIGTNSSSSTDPWYETESEKSETGLSNVQLATQEKIQKLKSWFPECPEKVIRSALEKEKNNVGIACFELQKRGYKNVNLEQTSGTPSKQADKVQTLQAMFPAAGSHLIQDILSGCGYNTEEAKSLLKNLGYHPASTSGNSKHLSTPTNATGRSKSPNRSTTPKNKAASPKPAVSVPKVSEHKKKELKTKYEAHFKSLPPSVVHMALESCNYNEETVKRLLELNQEDVERSKSQASSRPFSASSTASSISSTMFSIPTYKPTAVQLEPVIFGSDDSSAKKTGSASSAKAKGKTGKAQSKSRDVTPSKVSSTPKPSTSSKTATPKSTKASPQRTVDKSKITDVTRKTITPKRTTISTQPQRYESQYRTIPKGPDPSYRCGPDKSLLSSQGCLAQGPNPDYHVGPEHGLAEGPRGAVGPDVTLRCGPQSSLFHQSNIQRGGILISDI